MVVETVDSLELRRRLTGVKFTVLSARTGISYKRIWRFFRDTGPLTRQEMARVEAALWETGGESDTSTNAPEHARITDAGSPSGPSHEGLADRNDEAQEVPMAEEEPAQDAGPRNTEPGSPE